MAGSIVKRGETYYLRFDLAPVNGNRRQKLVSCKGATRKQAEQKLREILSEIHQGRYAEPTKQTLKEYLDRWLLRQETRLSPTTLYGYRKYIDLHISPELGNIRLDRLTPSAIQDFYDSLERRDGNPSGLSTKTIRNIHGILHSALAQAEKQEIISRNPADKVDQPRLIRAEVAIASTEDVSRLLSVLQRTVWYTPVLIVLGTGLRRGEVLALKWEDYDPISRTLTVRRSLAQLPGKIIPKEPKSRRPRLVKVPDFLASYLAEYRKTQAGRKTDLVGVVSVESWICTDHAGFALTPQALSTAFRRAAKDLGITVRLHGLRHMQATMLITGGVPAKIASERLGHANIQITNDTYAHVLPHDQDLAAELVDKVLRPCLPNTDFGESS